MSIEEKINEIDSLIKMLNQANENSEIENFIIEKNSLATSQNIKTVANVYRNSSYINKKFTDVFRGFYAFDSEEIYDAYNHFNKELSFFASFFTNKDFSLPDDIYITIDDEDNPYVDAPEVVRNIKRFLPVFNFQGDFLVVDLASETCGSLYLLDGYLALFLSPSLIEYVEDIKGGLSNGKYELDEDGDIVL